MKAMFIHNNAYDTILVNNGYSLMVEDELREFIVPNMDFDNWASPDTWEEHGDIMELASSAYGETVAYVDDNGKLIVVNEKLWESRLEFYDIIDYSKIIPKELQGN